MEDDLILDSIPHEVFENYKNDYLKNGYPGTVHAYYFIDVLEHWKRKNPSLNMSILAPNGDPYLGIVFFFLMDIFEEFIPLKKNEDNKTEEEEKKLELENSDSKNEVSHRKDLLHGSYYAPDIESAQILQKAIENTLEKFPDRFPFLKTDMTLLSCMNFDLFSIIEKFTIGPGWRTCRKKCFWLPWSIAKEMEVEIPEGVEIRPLTTEHATQIDRYWPSRHPGSKELIRTMIDINFGFGVFRGDTLLSWVIRWYYGGIGAIQTLETERRKGYARAVVQAMTKRMGELEKDVHLTVVEGNETGEAFFRSLGFQFAFENKWRQHAC